MNPELDPASHPKEGWVAVFSTGYDYEAEIVRDRLDDSGIPAVVYDRKAQMFELTVGDLSPIDVVVPESHREEALEILNSETLEADLEAAALAAPADPDVQEELESMDEDEYLDSDPDVEPPSDATSSAPREPEA